MKLLYLYLDFTQNGKEPEGYRGHKQCELNFGTEDLYTLKRTSGNEARYRLKRVRREENAQVEPGFWGDERICGISAIVGENGTGKTTLIHAMIKVLTALYEGNSKNRFPFDFVCLMQDTEGQNVLVSSGQQMEVEASDFPCRRISYPDCGGSEPLAALRRTKLLYFSNAVSMADMEQYRTLHNDSQHPYTDFLYDCSMFAGMLQAQEASSIGSSERLLGDQLYTYFTFESYQQTRYLFDRNQRVLLHRMRREGYPVPFPRELKLGINSSVERLKQIMESTEQLNFIGGFSEFREEYDAFTNQHQRGYLVLTELSLNCLINFLLRAGKVSKQGIAASVMLPRTFREPQSYIRVIDSIPSPSNSRELESYRSHCKMYIEFLWNNANHIQRYWQYDNRGIYHIALGDSLDPVLQELMIRFVNLNRAISQWDYFVFYSWGLSSGETIMLRIFTKLRHLLCGSPYDEECTDPIPAAPGDKNALAQRNEVIVNQPRDDFAQVCDSVILFLDEADLSLHPEWQRIFVATLAEYLPRLYQDPYYQGAESGCRNIQIIMTTHSPLMLGDFQSASVLYLKKDKEGFSTVECSSLQPFGQNLYTLLKDGFYLQRGTIGELARKKIDAALADIQTVKNLEEFDTAALEEWEARLEDHRRKTIKYLPGGILRGKLEEELDRALAVLAQNRNPAWKNRKRRELNQEIARLQRQLYELENEGKGSL